jgi:hypothetical protein
LPFSPPLLVELLRAVPIIVQVGPVAKQGAHRANPNLAWTLLLEDILQNLVGLLLVGIKT